MAEDQPTKKRRIRPAETVRQQADKVQKKAQKKDSKPRQRGRVQGVFAAAGKPLGPIKPVLRPFAWLGRHIIPGYIKNSFKELKFVTWPNRKESRQLTTAVVLFSVVFGILISIVDYGLSKAFKKIFLKE